MKTTLSLAWNLGLALTIVSLSSALAQNEIKTPLPAPPAPAAQKKTTTPKLSAWTKEIVKLAEARIEEDVMLSFVDNSGLFNLGADHIIYLTDIGVPSAVINAMLRHDQEVIAGLRTLTISSDPGYEPLVEIKLITTNTAPAKPAPQPAASAAPALPPKTEQAINPEIKPATEKNAIAYPLTETIAPDFANDAKATVQPVSNKIAPPTGKKKYTYPVRSPHPEELLPPILVVKAVTRTPNLFIIEGFPPD